jgi:hypothetical protein
VGLLASADILRRRPLGTHSRQGGPLHQGLDVLYGARDARDQVLASGGRDEDRVLDADSQVLVRVDDLGFVGDRHPRAQHDLATF